MIGRAAPDEHQIATSRAAALRAVVARDREALLRVAGDRAIAARGMRALAGDWPSPAAGWLTHSADGSTLADETNLTRCAGHHARQAGAADCATGCRLDAPTEAGRAQVLAIGNGTPSAGAIFVEADLACSLAWGRAGGRDCWAGRCLDYAAASSARAACARSSVRAAAAHSRRCAARFRDGAARS